MTHLDAHYQPWYGRGVLQRFAAKRVDEFFRSETLFLERYGSTLTSVLDIGCASGRMIELLARYTKQLEYTGVDLVADNIAQARQYYPHATFHLGNALEFQPAARYDLVNATGVCQHEPRFEDLIRHMLSLSRRLVMFDVKLAEVPSHVVDTDRSYCDAKEARLYYVLLASVPFLDFLRSLSGVATIEIFGYQTPTSVDVHLPAGVEKVVSAGVCLTRGESPEPKLSVDLPAWLVDNDEAVRTSVGDQDASA